MAEKYYILDSRTQVGNCALWWRVNGAGYTDNLDEAWLLDEATAKRDARRPTDKLVPESLARKHAHTS
jgi:hypothetical protein